MEEIWKDIEGFPGYIVSNFGNVKSSRRTRGRRFDFKKPRILGRYKCNGHGYYYVTMMQGKKIIGKVVHRLVAVAFVLNPYNKPEVNHIDGNSFNNMADNLEWVTCLENHAHSIRMGLKARGEHHGISKLTESQVIEARYLYDNRLLSLHKLAKKYNIDRSTITNAVKRITWKYISDN